MSMTQSGRLDLSSNNAGEITGGDTSTFTQVVFPTPFPANSQVIVLTQVQTFRGPDTPGVRIHDVNVNGFKIRLNEPRRQRRGPGRRQAHRRDHRLDRHHGQRLTPRGEQGCAPRVAARTRTRPVRERGASAQSASLDGVTGSPDLRTTGRTLHGKLIHLSVRFHTYSHFTSEWDFS